MRTKVNHNTKVMLMAACAALALVPVAAEARETARVSYDISAQDLGSALTELARQSNREIYFSADLTRGKRARRLSGKMSFEAALQRLLEGSDLHYRVNSTGSVVIEAGELSAKQLKQVRTKVEEVQAERGRDADGRATLPDILVTGKRNWNLNLDIKRTADDAQPYVVFTRKQIQQSGSVTLEDFLRNNLTSNTTAANSDQVKNSQSSVSLRGLGVGNTLILVDGRRYAQANLGSGTLTQTSINGIPLDAIDRIEILASSASGIYGSSAVGGVINIIMRRDYHGLEATAYYGNSSRFDSGQKRLTVSGSFPLEGGRTRVSFNASYQQTDGLYEGDRDYIARGRALTLSVNPNYANQFLNPIIGATPNIMNNSTDPVTRIPLPLKLKPAYGGTTLSGNTTFVPVGYRGIALDGVAALVANAGKQNLDLGPTVAGGSFGNGALSTLIMPTKNYAASVTVRRDFTKWLNVYAQFDYTRYENKLLLNAAANVYTLPASSADNPFTTSIKISLPVKDGNVLTVTPSTTKRALAGAIIKLPYTWQVAVDLTWNWTGFRTVKALAPFDKATLTGLQTGTLSVVKDINQFPVPFSYLDNPAGGTLRPSGGTSRSYTLKLAGPLPWLRLWGGKPITTVQLERDTQTQGDYVAYTNGATAGSSTISYTPSRSQRIDSAYGEVRFPIIGKDNKVPLIRELELQLAGRYDHYTEVGANTSLRCYPALGTSLPGPLPDDAFDLPCPQPGATKPVFATTRNSSFNKTVALRWEVSRDLTFRGSYSTGYTPPILTQLIQDTSAAQPLYVGTLLLGTGAIVNATDPKRGNEPIGQLDLGGFGLRLIPVTQGGNVNVDPQTSKSWTVGTILTPRFLPGLRLSVDWTKIVQRNVYFSPASLLQSGGTPSPVLQKALEDFMAAHPERFTRDTNPATFGSFGLGPITAIDVSTANFSLFRTEAVDFAASYDVKLGKGTLSFQGAASWLRDLTQQQQPSSTPQNYAGVIDTFFSSSTSGVGGVSWKANGSIVYSSLRWSLGVNGRYFGPYWLALNHSVNPLQGSARIRAQAYFDVFGSYLINSKTQVRAGVNNVLDRSPNINASAGGFYSYFGDPRRANFYLSVNRKF
jgi:outer membrane receptor protein involved in Fe transport